MSGNEHKSIGMHQSDLFQAWKSKIKKLNAHGEKE